MKNHNNYYVYMMASMNNKALYTGVTNNVANRSADHKNGLGSIFTSKYHCCKLVYYEHFTQIVDAIAREKQLKRWCREKKESLINIENPKWEDILEERG